MLDQLRLHTFKLAKNFPLDDNMHHFAIFPTMNFLQVIRPYIQLIRPSQHVKNMSLGLPALFGLRLMELEVWFSLLWAIFCFSMMAAGVYIFNDYEDQEADRKHPTKQYRPLAAGTVSPRHALILMGVCWLIGLSGLFLLHVVAGLLGMIYVSLNISYSYWLKHIAIIDLVIIALGFIIRIFVGAFAIEPVVPVSVWLVLMIFLGAVFLGLAKRRDDVIRGDREARPAIDGYNLPFINSAMTMMGSVLIVAYLAYTLAPTTQQKFDAPYLYVTTLFVLIGVLRYLQLAFVYEKTANPTQLLLKDPLMGGSVLLWALTSSLMIYG